MCGWCPRCARARSIGKSRRPVRDAKACSEGLNNLGTFRIRGALYTDTLPNPPVFWQKRLQTLENKGNGWEKREARENKRLQAAEKIGFDTPPGPGQRPALRHKGG